MMSPPAKAHKWYQIKWFQDHDTPEERKLIVYAVPACTFRVLTFTMLQNEH
jgi:hypothetical protein